MNINILIIAVIVLFLIAFFDKKKQSLIFASSLITVYLLFKTPLNKLFFYLKETGLSTMLSLWLGIFLLSCLTFVIYLIISRVKNYFTK